MNNDSTYNLIVACGCNPDTKMENGQTAYEYLDSTIAGALDDIQEQEEIEDNDES